MLCHISFAESYSHFCGFLEVFFILLGELSKQSEHVSIRLGVTRCKDSMNPVMGEKQRKRLFADRVKSSVSPFTTARYCQTLSEKRVDANLFS